MSFDLYTIVENTLNGNPIHDAIIVGTIFVCFYTFYHVFFSAIFSIFSK